MTAAVEVYEPEWSLGDRIAKVRKDVLGLEQEELAEKLGVTGGAVSNWESDTRRPRDLLGVAQQLEELSAETGRRVEAQWVLGLRTGSRWTLFETTDAQLELPLDATEPNLVLVTSPA